MFRTPGQLSLDNIFGLMLYCEAHAFAWVSHTKPRYTYLSSDALQLILSFGVFVIFLRGQIGVLMDNKLGVSSVRLQPRRQSTSWAA